MTRRSRVTYDNIDVFLVHFGIFKDKFEVLQLPMTAFAFPVQAGHCTIMMTSDSFRNFEAAFRRQAAQHRDAPAKHDSGCW